MSIAYDVENDFILDADMTALSTGETSADSHTHDNKAVLDSLTPELFTELYKLQEFEDSTSEKIHTLQEKIDSLPTSMHAHKNKEILDSITAPYTAEEKKKLAGISPENGTEK